jgi:hypothetical protein
VTRAEPCPKPAGRPRNRGETPSRATQSGETGSHGTLNRPERHPIRQLPQRSAFPYQLTLAPKDAGSLVSAVRIAVDGDTYVPLRVQVDSASTGAAALSIGFTSVSFAPIDPAEFAFTPPPGSTVTSGDAVPSGGMFASLSREADTTVVGSGWTSVVLAHPGKGGVSASTELPGVPGSVGALLRSLPTVSGSWGTGHILAGTLVTVVITDDGTVAAGAATPKVVMAALAHS